MQYKRYTIVKEEENADITVIGDFDFTGTLRWLFKNATKGKYILVRDDETIGFFNDRKLFMFAQQKNGRWKEETMTIAV